MRLREYLEIQNGLKSKLRESNSNGQPDVVELIKDAYFNKKPASFINDILAAGYDTGDKYSYGAGEAQLVYFDDLDYWLKENMKYCKDIKDFPDFVWDTVVDQIDILGDFQLIENMSGPIGSLYDFYFALLPADDLNFEDYSKEIIAVDKGQGVLYVGHKAYEIFINALEYMVTSNKLATPAAAVDFFIDHYIEVAEDEDDSEEITDDEDDDESDDEDQEGDEAWQEAADELANYNVIQIDDELKTGNFLKYLVKQGIQATEVITVDEFTKLLLNYLDKNIKISSNLGYIFCTGDHLYLYRDGDVMHLNMREDYSLDYFPNFEFNSDLARDIYSELPGKPAYRAHQKATLKDTVANLISITSEAYSAAVDLL